MWNKCVVWMQKWLIVCARDHARMCTCHWREVENFWLKNLLLFYTLHRAIKLKWKKTACSLNQKTDTAHMLILYIYFKHFKSLHTQSSSNHSFKPSFQSLIHTSKPSCAFMSRYTPRYESRECLESTTTKIITKCGGVESSDSRHSYSLSSLITKTPSKEL